MRKFLHGFLINSKTSKIYKDSSSKPEMCHSCDADCILYVYCMYTLPVRTGGLGLRKVLISSAAACFHGKLQYHPKVDSEFLKKSRQTNTEFADEVFVLIFKFKAK